MLHDGGLCQWDYSGDKRKWTSLQQILFVENPEFSKTEVVKAYAHTVVAAAMDYWKHTIEVKKGPQVARKKAVRIFNPLYVL
jgi:hypothetical protein